MSRIGKAPIPVPSGAKIDIKDGVFRVEGPKGKLSQKVVDGIEVAVESDQVVVKRSSEEGPVRAKHGLMRSLLSNAVIGVTEGWKKELEIQGVGYRGEVKGKEVHLALGFSHPVVYAVPKDIDVAIDKQNKITVSGVDKQQVGQVAAELRGLRPPDAYKGKGIKYVDEVLRLKVGKAGIGGTA